LNLNYSIRKQTLENTNELPISMVTIIGFYITIFGREVLPKSRAIAALFPGITTKSTQDKGYAKE